MANNPTVSTLGGFSNPEAYKDTPEVRMMHEAVDKLMKSVSKQHSVSKVSNVSLSKRFNGKSGIHVHATCSIKIRFDESVGTDYNDVAANY